MLPERRVVVTMRTCTRMCMDALGSYYFTASASNAVHDASVSELRRLGYVVVTNTSEADAVLKSSWRIKKSEDNRNDLQVASLSVSLFDRKNRRLFDADSGPSVPANFWNESRASTEIANMLNRLGRATTLQK